MALAKNSLNWSLNLGLSDKFVMFMTPTNGKLITKINQIWKFGKGIKYIKCILTSMFSVHSCPSRDWKRTMPWHILYICTKIQRPLVLGSTVWHFIRHDKRPRSSLLLLTTAYWVILMRTKTKFVNQQLLSHVKCL